MTTGTMRALVVAVKGSDQVPVKTVQIPTIEAHQILVKNRAVALNPTDWKHRDNLTPPGAWLGMDFCGDVIEVGSSVKNVSKGDRVAGISWGGRTPDNGTFAEYVRADSALVWKVPEGLDDEEAAAMGGVGPDTCLQALYQALGLNRPDNPTTDSKPILIWGGSTSVGLYAVQLAKASGYKVLATASPKNHELIKSLGAEKVYDYSQENVSEQIAKDFPELNLGLDTISEKGTTLKLAQSFSNKVGHIVTLLPVNDDKLKELSDIKVEGTLLYTAFGKEFDFFGKQFPASPNDHKEYANWQAGFADLVNKGIIKSNPLWRQEGGLDKINEGLELLKAGKNSAQKITYKL